MFGGIAVRHKTAFGLKYTYIYITLTVAFRLISPLLSNNAGFEVICRFLNRFREIFLFLNVTVNDICGGKSTSYPVSLLILVTTVSCSTRTYSARIDTNNQITWANIINFLRLDKHIFSQVCTVKFQ